MSWDEQRLKSKGKTTMNYQKVYDQLVQKNHVFSEGEYFETHHKVPVSLGGTDDASNLVNLTAREHYIAHLLLVKISYQTNDIQAYKKMLYAFNCMKWGRCKGKRTFKFNSRLYQLMKERYSMLRSQMMRTSHNPSLGKRWVSDMFNELCYSIEKTIPLEEYQLPTRISDFNEYRLKKANEQMQEIAKKEYQKKLHEMQETFFCAFYDEYLKNGFDSMCRKYKMEFEISAFLHLCKKRVPYYSSWNRWKQRDK